jgi:hypothetical protein
VGLRQQPYETLLEAQPQRLRVIGEPHHQHAGDIDGCRVTSSQARCLLDLPHGVAHIARRRVGIENYAIS